EHVMVKVVNNSGNVTVAPNFGTAIDWGHMHGEGFTNGLTRAPSEFSYSGFVEHERLLLIHSGFLCKGLSCNQLDAHRFNKVGRHAKTSHLTGRTRDY